MYTPDTSPDTSSQENNPQFLSDSATTPQNPNQREVNTAKTDPSALLLLELELSRRRKASRQNAMAPTVSRAIGISILLFLWMIGIFAMLRLQTLRQAKPKPSQPIYSVNIQTSPSPRPPVKSHP